MTFQAGHLFHELGVALAGATLVVVPFVVASEAQDSFRLPKLMTAECLALASLLALSVGSALAPRKIANGPSDLWASLREHHAISALVPLLAVATLGLLYSDHPNHVRQGLIDFWIGSACLAGWSIAISSRNLQRLLGVLVVPGVGLAAIAVLQAHDLFEPLSLLRALPVRLGITSLAGNTGDLAAFLVMPALVAQWRLASSISSPSGRAAPMHRVRVTLWAASLGICLYGIAMTQTITALVGISVGSALLWIAVFGWHRAWAVGAAAALALTFLVVVVGPLRTRLLGFASSFETGRIDALFSGRLDGWRAALFMLREHPVLGVGHGAYRAEYAPAKLTMSRESLAPGRDSFFVNAHNEFLEVGAELGLLGLLALAWALWKLIGALRTGFPRARDDDRGGRVDRGFARGLLAALLILSLGHFPFRLAVVAFPALASIAWIFRRSHERSESDGFNGSRAPVARWIVVAALGLFSVGQLQRAHDRLAASKLVKNAITTTRIAIDQNRLSGGLVRNNIRSLLDARHLDPSDVSILVALVGHYRLLGNSAASHDVLREALELEPRPEIYFNLGLTLLDLERPSEARTAFADAVLLRPILRRRVPEEFRPPPPREANQKGQSP